jgi:hypothetical protein
MPYRVQSQSLSLSLEEGAQASVFAVGGGHPLRVTSYARCERSAVCHPLFYRTVQTTGGPARGNRAEPVRPRPGRSTLIEADVSK